MKRGLLLLMLMGALLGLLGQEAAIAHAMPVKASAPAASTPQMDADCAEMMGLAKQKPSPEKPCQGMTPDCMAKMGCAAPVALLPPLAPGLSRDVRPILPSPMPVAALAGRETGPEPDPPTRLG